MNPATKRWVIRFLKVTGFALLSAVAGVAVQEFGKLELTGVWQYIYTLVWPALAGALAALDKWARDKASALKGNEPAL